MAAFIAVRSGKAEGYFVPKMAYLFLLGLVFAGSAVIRKPLTGFIIAQLYRAQPGWVDLPAVRRVMTEYTLAWAVLFLLRGAVYAVLIAAGRVGSARGRVDRYGASVCSPCCCSWAIAISREGSNSSARLNPGPSRLLERAVGVGPVALQRVAAAALAG